jgi:hypothetical protein
MLTIWFENDFVYQLLSGDHAKIEVTTALHLPIPRISSESWLVGFSNKT